MDEAEDDVLAYMAFPPEHWAHLSSADPLERLIKGIKRWALVVRIQPIDASIIHITGPS